MLTNAVAIAAGGFHSMALRSNGTVAWWGGNAPSVPSGLSNVVAIAAGGNSSLLLFSDGTVWPAKAGLSNVVAIACGIDNNLALRSDGTVFCWGGVNQYHQNDPPAGLSNVVSVVGGPNYGSALRNDGSAVRWGIGGTAEMPSSISNVIQNVAGYADAALCSDHQIRRWAPGTVLPAFPWAQTNFAYIAAGGDCYFAVTPQAVILTNPAAMRVAAGSSRTLSCSAISGTPLTYQWLLAGTELPGATSSVLSLSNLQAVTAGPYSVRLSNAGGSITSAVAQVTVNPTPPSILTNPVARTVVAGASVGFQVNVSGSEPLSVQWLFNGAPLAGETNAALLLANVTDFNAGRYQAVVTNAYGSNASAQVNLTINDPPAITNGVISLRVPAGTNLVLQGSVRGTPPINLQWQFLGVSVPGATNSALSLTNIQASNGGEYSLVASNAFGQTTNELYDLSVVASPPIIYRQPASQTFKTNQPVTLRVLAGGSSPMSFQWQHDGNAISGATDAQLALANPQSTDAGSYSVSISNAYGSTNSATATLTAGAPNGGQDDWPSLLLTQVTTNTFKSPTCVTHAGDGSGRQFLVQQSGQIVIIQSNAVLSTPFLDMSKLIVTGTEQGLLGLVFSPGFATNGHFYVDYTRAGDSFTVISRFSVLADNPNLADTNSEQIIKVIPQIYPNHKGGQLAFGPDGYLYIGMGDGGFDLYNSGLGDPQNNAQNPQSLLGKILRLDVEGGTSPYAVPASNPFVGNTNYAPEIWALGLRNPWRFSFDRLTGDLFIGDVGHSSFEEIDFQPANSPGGQNYGWKVMEGPSSYAYPGPGFDYASLTPPVSWYAHPLGIAVIGGYVYRGPHEARMDGLYFFGDFGTGRFWALKHSGSNWTRFELLHTVCATSTFGEDEQGNLYVTDYVRGQLYRMSDSRSVLSPTLSIPAGTFTNAQTVAVACATPGATIRYTTDGRDPNEFDAEVAPDGNISVNASMTLKVRAFRDDLLPSAVVAANLNFQVAAPSFSPVLNPYGPTAITNGTQIAITSPTAGAVIHYTLDGQDATQWSPVYSGPFVINANAMVRARSFMNGYAASPMVAANYSWLKAPTPQIQPPQGHLQSNTLVSISCDFPSAELHYTTDGTLPSLAATLYNGPFVASGATTIRAEAWVPNYAPSDVATATFTSELRVQPITFSGGQAVITFNTFPYLWYSVEYSDDLVTWTLLSASEGYGAPMSITDPTPIQGHPQRFYRVTTSQ